MVFHDRFEAGRLLGERLASLRRDKAVLVLALPRGGVPVAYEVAKALAAPLDVLLVRKLGYPAQPELAMGAIASGGAVVLNQDAIDELDIPRQVIEQVAARELEQLRRREEIYRRDRPPVDVADRIVILVDDGLATGSTMRAAVGTLKRQRPRRLIIAVPVGARVTCAELSREADEVVCVECPPDFRAVGVWYRDFSPVADETVQRLLHDAAALQATPTAPQE